MAIVNETIAGRRYSDAKRPVRGRWLLPENAVSLIFHSVSYANAEEEIYVSVQVGGAEKELVNVGARHAHNDNSAATGTRAVRV